MHGTIVSCADYHMLCGVTNSLRVYPVCPASFALNVAYRYWHILLVACGSRNMQMLFDILSGEPDAKFLTTTALSRIADL